MLAEHGLRHRSNPITFRGKEIGLFLIGKRKAVAHLVAEEHKIEGKLESRINIMHHSTQDYGRLHKFGDALEKATRIRVNQF